KCAVSGAPVVRAGKDDEKGGCIDRSIITLERNLAQDGHLACACLVKDFAWLCILLGVLCIRLRSSQIRQDAAREGGIKPHALERGNNSVLPKFRAKPRNTSVRIRSIRSFGPHHFKIGERAIQPIVELLI